MDLKLFFSTFALIFVAELPDKTALATVLMATRGSPWPIFVGVAMAFIVQTIVAVLFGSLIGKLPGIWVHLLAGLLFIVFAVIAWKHSLEDEEDENSEDSKPAPQGFLKKSWAAFMVIFIAEWGDLTQLATASLSARFNSPFTLFCSAVLALWSVTAIAIWIGHKAKAFINPHVLGKIAAVLFFAVGVVILYRR